MEFSRTMSVVGSVVLLIYVFASCCSSEEAVSGKKIIALFFMSTKSTRNAVDPLLNALGQRGHEVTVISPIRTSEVHPNVRHINGFDFQSLMKHIPNMFEARMVRNEVNPFFQIPFFEKLCRSHYELPEMKEILTQRFDLVIISSIFNECVYGLMHHLNTTVLNFAAVASPIWTSANFGAPVLPSFLPLHLLSLTHEMDFFERVRNMFGYMMAFGLRKFYYEPRIEQIYRDYFPDTPSIAEIEQNIPFMLMNSHPSLNFPRPLLPNMVEVGGLHCRPAEPLPVDLEDFVNASGQNGFIYFSMGSVVPGHSMPESFRNIFLKVFGKLKQRVLWKWETETMPDADVPPNVKLGKWFPQQDVMGHPLLKLFITQGGMMSTFEAAYHGVPMIGIPMFTDQDGNIRQAESVGYALSLEFNEITEQVLLGKLNQILMNPGFTAKAKSLSRILQDEPEKPLDRAVFWTEFLMRHRGAPHLQSPARHLTSLEYHSIDIMATIVVLFFGVLIAMHQLAKLVIRIWQGLGRKSTLTPVKSERKLKKLQKRD